MISTSTEMVSNFSTSNFKWSHDVFLRYKYTYNFSNLMFTTLIQRGFSTLEMIIFIGEGEIYKKCLLASSHSIK